LQGLCWAYINSNTVPLLQKPNAIRIEQRINCDLSPRSPGHRHQQAGHFCITPAGGEGVRHFKPAIMFALPMVRPHAGALTIVSLSLPASLGADLLLLIRLNNVRSAEMIKQLNNDFIEPGRWYFPVSLADNTPRYRMARPSNPVLGAAEPKRSFA
jgi:hypothetical protein